MFSIKKLSRILFWFYTILIVGTYVVIAMSPDVAARFPLKVAVTYFSIISVHLVWWAFFVIGYTKRSWKSDGFILTALACILITFTVYFGFIYFGKNGTLDSFLSMGELGAVLIVHDLIVHAMMPIILLSIVSYEIISKQRKYMWRSLLFPFPFLLAYHFYVMFYTQWQNIPYPYPVFDPEKIGWNTLIRNYAIAVIGSHSVLLFLYSFGLGGKKDDKIRYKG